MQSDTIKQYNTNSPTGSLENAQNLRASDRLDLGDTMRVAQDQTNLRGSQTLASQLADLIAEVVRRNLQPRRGSATVGEGGIRNTLAIKVLDIIT